MTFPELIVEAQKLGFTHVRIPARDHLNQSGTTLALWEWPSPRSGHWEGFQILNGEMAVDELAGASSFKGAWPLLRRGPSLARGTA